MRATFTQEQEQLAEVAADMGADGLAAARRLADGQGRDGDPTSSLFAGFAGLGIPESAGGEGGDLVDLAVLVEGLARTITPTPWVAHAVGTQVLFGAGLDPSSAASGDQVVVPADGAASNVSIDGAFVGVVAAVSDGADARNAVVCDGEGKVAVAAVTESRPRPGLDFTRPVADLSLEVVGPVGDIGNGRERAAVVVAADLCGVGRGALTIAARYASEREQFGQPIGKFQGVAHQLAEALAYVDAAWSLTVYAAWALDANAPDGTNAAHAAKARAGAAAVHAAERALQVHGGIGMTWEADPHLMLRRALASDTWMGGRSEHRRALARSILRVAS
jgi:alkylation response protein AidB-like acyl-CoA dehydrogenase